jgi:hypothetical protein
MYLTGMAGTGIGKILIFVLHFCINIEKLEKY